MTNTEKHLERGENRPLSPMLKTILATLLLAILHSPCYAQQNYADYYRMSMDAYEKNAYNTFLEAARKADSLRPNHPTLLYNLAKGYALNGRPGQAIATLRYRSLFYASEDYLSDDDFNTLRDAAAYGRLSREIERLHSPRQTSRKAFELKLDGRAIHPEGIAYDPAGERFFISDIRHGAIYAVHRDGSKPRMFLDLASEGYWSAMGMQVDPSDPNRLWLTSSAMPEFAGYDSTMAGRSAVLAVSLDAGKIETSYSAAGRHLFGDLTVASDGTVYVTDSYEPVIYRIEPGLSAGIQTFLNREVWWNLQGLALNDKETILYVSDYILGIFKVNLQTLESVPLLDRENARTRGSDGLCLTGNRLLFLQNGTLPKRVGIVRLDPSGNAVAETLEYTDRALPELDEPTLGTAAEGAFYYIANSPWGHYDRQQRPLFNEWTAPRIFRLRVE